MSPTLHPIIEEHREGIIALCREFGVAKLEVFGSVMTEKFDVHRSDVDFLVTYPPGYDFGPWVGRFQDLEESLTSVLGVKAHLVMTSALRDSSFRNEIEGTRRTLFDAATFAEVA